MLEVPIERRLARYYWGLGFGNKFSSLEPDITQNAMRELFLGVELPNGSWKILSYSLELAYEWVELKDHSQRDNLRINIGSHFYF
jgi:hypothetical protein